MKTKPILLLIMLTLVAFTLSVAPATASCCTLCTAEEMQCDMTCGQNVVCLRACLNACRNCVVMCGACATGTC